MSNYLIFCVVSSIIHWHNQCFQTRTYSSVFSFQKKHNVHNYSPNVNNDLPIVSVCQHVYRVSSLGSPPKPVSLICRQIIRVLWILSHYHVVLFSTDYSLYEITPLSYLELHATSIESLQQAIAM